MDYKIKVNRKIFIKNLILIASIGVYEQEKKINKK
jgi:dihydroneopterin aldolase